MSNNPIFTTEDCVAAQRTLRINMAVEQGCPNVSQAYEIASAVADANSVGHPAGFHIGPNNTPVPNKRSTPTNFQPIKTQKCCEHRERSFTFSDGTVMQACCATDCMWGKGRKTHSDGTRGGVLYSPEVLDHIEDEEVEVSPDDPNEIQVDGTFDGESDLDLEQVLKREARETARQMSDSEGNLVEEEYV